MTATEKVKIYESILKKLSLAYSMHNEEKVFMILNQFQNWKFSSKLTDEQELNQYYILENIKKL